MPCLTPGVAKTHNARGEQFRIELTALIKEHDFPAQVTGIGSLMRVHMQRGLIWRPAEAATVNPSAMALFHLKMLAVGFYLFRRRFMSLSLPLREIDCRSYLEAFEEFMETSTTQFTETF